MIKVRRAGDEVKKKRMDEAKRIMETEMLKIRKRT